ncbi:hypothetical protein PHLH8_21050 [Pseudomonas sp. Pc102]|uniref:hypothetical protein n=1 Tax=Pseudomonas sp. Pc102 TaxID=2678261 RepID=UPI001BCFF629|nr:hypothetical protein [Pseudomonas sp. Pc102]BBP82463.1 hypothetical protein PHLH8_21050 [Pseudomonas sp. Pc102]
MSEQTEGRRHWHLDKSVSISHILTTVVLLLGALKFSFDMEKRIALLEANTNVQTSALTQLLDNQRRTDARQDAEIDAIKRQAREDYMDLGKKMERLIDYNQRAIRSSK